jgi:hypothetical protein
MQTLSPCGFCATRKLYFTYSDITRASSMLICCLIPAFADYRQLALYVVVRKVSLRPQVLVS